MSTFIGYLSNGNGGERPTFVCIQREGGRCPFWCAWRVACAEVGGNGYTDPWLDKVFRAGQDVIPPGPIGLFVPDLRAGLIKKSPKNNRSFDSAVARYNAQAAAAAAPVPNERPLRPANTTCQGRHKLRKVIPASELYIEDGGWKCDECEEDGDGPVLHCESCDAYDRCDVCQALYDSEDEEGYDDSERE